MSEAKLARYHCTHCGRDFEAEAKEFIECPGCFWSTSVKPQEEAADADEVSDAAPAAAAGKHRFDFFLFGKFLMRFFVILALVVLVVAAAVFVMKKMAHRDTVPGQASSNLRLSPGKDIQKGKEPPAPSLTDHDRQVLQTKAELPAQISATPEQKQVLDQRVPLKTGLVEKLPSSPWTEENFRQMLKEQETFYKISLARSYKGKLVDLFKKKYLPAQQAFAAGDLLKARDLWVESLAFPVYADNIARHRGVVLTMLRAFINDTLSKIGAINQSLVEGNTRSRENELGSLYAQLVEHLGSQAWAGALNAADQLEEVMKDLEQIQTQKGGAPAYPPAIGQVDQDIAAAMMDLLNSAPPSVADLAALQQDIEAKKAVLETLILENIQAQKAIYDEAVELIGAQQWEEAQQKLSEVRFPEELVRDAQAKMQVLSNWQNPGLDSQKESG